MRHSPLAVLVALVFFGLPYFTYASLGDIPLSSWPAAGGDIFGTNNVNAVVAASDGSVYIGGSFTTVGGVTRNYLAHVLADGTVDSNFNPNLDSVVHSLALSSDNTTLYVGGDFAFVNGGTIARNGLAAFTPATTSTPTSFNPNMNGGVLALALSSDDTMLYAVGTFSSVNGGTSRGFGASFTPQTTSTATSFNPDLSDAAHALALSSDDITLYIGGNFFTINGGVSQQRIAAFTPQTTSTATAFNPGMQAGSIVYELALSSNDSILYAGGTFTTVNSGVTRNRLAAFSTNATGTVTVFNPNIGGEVHAISLSPDDTKLYVGGDFTTVNGSVTRNGLAGFSVVSTGTATSFNPNMQSRVFALQNIVYDGDDRLYAGGEFFDVGGNTDFAKFAVFSGVYVPPDTTAPVVTLLGDNPAYFTITNPYHEFGATATDDTDGALSVSINTSGVDMNTAGTYTVTYSATDAASNVGSSTRSVIVNPIAGTVGVGNSISIAQSGGGGGSSYTPPPATTSSSATSTPDPTDALKAQIAALLKQIADLQAQIAARTSTTPFTRDLKLADRGDDVKALQIYLNTHGFVVSDIPGGPGFSGYETTVFGYATQGAVKKFQEAHAAEILTPLGLTQGTGIFGASTRGYVNQNR